MSRKMLSKSVRHYQPVVNNTGQPLTIRWSDGSASVVAPGHGIDTWRDHRGKLHRTDEVMLTPGTHYVDQPIELSSPPGQPRSRRRSRGT